MQCLVAKIPFLPLLSLSPPSPRPPSPLPSGPPVVYVSPIRSERVYTVESGYFTNVTCAADSRTLPSSPPVNLLTPNQGFRRRKRIISLGGILRTQLLLDRPAARSDSGNYSCVSSGPETTTENIIIQVIGELPSLIIAPVWCHLLL